MLRLLACLLLSIALLTGCKTRPTAPEPEPPVPVAETAPPTTTRGEFTLEADKLDTWNAIGQIMVNTPGLEYVGRSQMLDLYDVRYRGEEILVLTKALLLSDTIKKTTTKVTATTKAGKPIDHDASADLLALLQRQLPEMIIEVQKRQAEEAKAKKKAKAKKSKKAKAKKA